MHSYERVTRYYCKQNVNTRSSTHEIRLICLRCMCPPFFPSVRYAQLRARVRTGDYRPPHLPQISPARPQQFIGTATRFADAPDKSRDSRFGVERPRRNDPHKDRNYDSTSKAEYGQEQGKIFFVVYLCAVNVDELLVTLCE